MTAQEDCFLNMPTVRVTVDSMRYEILEVLKPFYRDLEKHIKEEIERQIKNFDFNSLVKEETEYAIKRVVGGAVDDLIGWKLREQIVKEVRETIYKGLNKE